MYKCATASPAHANGGYANCVQMSKKEADTNHVCLRAQGRDGKNIQGPGHVRTRSLEPRERPWSTISTPCVAPCSHQQRRSADFSKCATSPVIIVKKNRKEPEPPQRTVSLLQPNTGSHPSFKRYSCPPGGVFISPSHPHSSSSSYSSSSNSSCSSPPPVQTIVITGHDPLGWKLRPKSSSRQVRAKRLSLPVLLPVICPDTQTAPKPEPSDIKTPARKPKPSSRRHSDSSAFLSSLAAPLPVVTLEELCTVHLRAVTLSDTYDDVFSGQNEEEVRVTPCKMPPPVPEKTPMARQTAQHIAHSRHRCKTTENIYTSVIEPKPQQSRLNGDHSGPHVRTAAGLRVDLGCSRERSKPRFPG